jgi:hypothetical protein
MNRVLELDKGTSRVDKEIVGKWRGIEPKVSSGRALEAGFPLHISTFYNQLVSKDGLDSMNVFERTPAIC